MVPGCSRLLCDFCSLCASGILQVCYQCTCTRGINPSELRRLAKGIQLEMKCVPSYFFVSKQVSCHLLRGLPMQLSIAIVNNSGDKRYFEEKSLKRIALTMQSKYDLPILIFSFVKTYCCRPFDHVMKIFFECVAPPNERCQLTVEDVWSWVECVWNESSFTRNVTKNELSEYLIMSLEFGHYMPRRNRPRHIFPSHEESGRF